ncbi:DegP protease 7 [Actinidia rufa]|uniref:DegP protease 7 n=1 Tax=Actinidia rufa TaxID=165716 RepID=A0A7J0H7Z5_9ERIC|nr:DegP protease 7 [Actinidia rufa]
MCRHLARLMVCIRNISPELGLVAVDKNTVAIAVSDVVFLHPVHNYAIVAYDPSALGAEGASIVCAAQLLPEPSLWCGDAFYLVGLSRSLQATSRKSVATNPLSALNIGSANGPRYRVTNVEVIELDTGNLESLWFELDLIFSNVGYGAAQSSSPSLSSYKFVLCLLS